MTQQMPLRCRLLGHKWKFDGGAGGLTSEHQSLYDHYSCERWPAWFNEPAGKMLPQKDLVIHES